MKNNQEEIIKKKWNRFFDEIISLNVNIFVLNKINDFPADLLRVRVTFNLFLDTFTRNTFQYSIVMVRRIIYDPGSNCLTLRKFKNELLEQLPDKLRQPINNEIKLIESTILRRYEDQINSLRHIKLAHLLEELIVDDAKIGSIKFEELKLISEAINEYFANLCKSLNIDFAIRLPDAYIERNQNKKATDIDQILNFMASQSEMLTLKEDQPEIWQDYLNKWSKENSVNKNLAIINNYRTRLLKLESISTVQNT